MDVAGDTATKRGIDLAQLQGFNIKVIRLKEGKDAAEIISKNPKDWEKAIENTKSILDFYFESAFAGKDKNTPDGKKEIAKILLPVLKRIPNQIEKSFWIQRLAEELESREDDLREELKKVKLEEDVFGLEPEEIINLPRKSRRELLEERLLTIVLKFPKNLNLIEENKISYFFPKVKEILVNLKNNQNYDFKNSPELADFFNYLSLRAEIEEIEEKDIIPEIKNCLKEIKSLEVKNKLEQISQEIKKAEKNKDSKKIEELMRQFNNLTKEIL